jgi:hypothetical protein
MVGVGGGNEGRCDHRPPEAPGTFITFDAPGATCGNTPPAPGFCGAFSTSINPAGEALGYTYDSSGVTTGFLTGFLRSNQSTFTTFGIAGALFFNIGFFGPPGNSLHPQKRSLGAILTRISFTRLRER